MTRQSIQVGRNIGKTFTMNAEREIRESLRRDGRRFWSIFHITKHRAMVSGLYQLKVSPLVGSVSITWSPSPPESAQADERHEFLMEEMATCFQIIGTDDYVIMSEGAWPHDKENVPFDDFSRGSEHLFRLYTHRFQETGVTDLWGTTRYHVFHGDIYYPSPREVLDGLVAADLEGRTGTLHLDELVIMPEERS